MSLSDYVEIATTKKITNPFSGSNMPFRLDVTFTLNTQETLELDTIVFQNYYVSSLTISQPVTPTSEFHHPILENKTLMRNPYTEDGAESWYSIHASEFDSYDKNRPLRFTLIQPCSTWNRVELQNFKAYGKSLSSQKKETERSTEFLVCGVPDSISEIVIGDFKILTEAVILQSTIRDNEFLDYETVTKSSIARKKEKKGKKDS